MLIVLMRIEHDIDIQFDELNPNRHNAVLGILAANLRKNRDSDPVWTLQLIGVWKEDSLIFPSYVGLPVIKSYPY